jgi:hypothetical protein
MTVGTPPGTGFQLVDGIWLTGLAGGQNETYQSGLAAAGSTQATATQIPSGIGIVEIDSGTGGVALPSAFPGMEITLYNNSGSGLTLYPNVQNNPITGAQDTINNGTTIASGVFINGYVAFLMCAKAGKWAFK